MAVKAPSNTHKQLLFELEALRAFIADTPISNTQTDDIPILRDVVLNNDAVLNNHEGISETRTEIQPKSETHHPFFPIDPLETPSKKSPQPLFQLIDSEHPPRETNIRSENSHQQGPLELSHLELSYLELSHLEPPHLEPHRIELSHDELQGSSTDQLMMENLNVDDDEINQILEETLNEILPIIESKLRKKLHRKLKNMLRAESSPA